MLTPKTYFLTGFLAFFLLAIALPVLAADDTTTSDVAATSTAATTTQAANADDQSPTLYYYGRVTAIVDQKTDNDPNLPPTDRFSQTVKVRLSNGPDANKEFTLSYTPGSADASAPQNLKAGEKIIVVSSNVFGTPAYYIYDRDRSGAVIWLVIGFFVLVVAFAGWKGVRSMFGLAFSIAVIIWYVIPQVLHGGNPFFVFLLGSLVIALVSIYVGHGFNRQTSVALASTLITIVLAIIVSTIAVHAAKLFGLGSEEAFYLQVGDLSSVNLRGLLLGGIIIGILGVLDDVTTAQSATVAQIYLANPALPMSELVKRGLVVGHEHIVSLVNTLALAYVGASFPLLLLFTEGQTPFAMIFNSERITEEVVRTLVGSSTLVIAVPIATYLAAYVFHRYGLGKKFVPHAHHH